MARERMLFFTISTRRRYSFMDTCASHWKGVWGLGTKQEVLTVIRTPRLLLAAWSFHVYSTFSASRPMASA